jgi:gamma-glutamyltranspeptidase / glutathione hydrolase
MDIAAAVDAPRVHNGNAKGIVAESRIPAEAITRLGSRRHETTLSTDFDRAMGSVQGIMFLPDGRTQRIGDRRRDGAAVGY